MILETDSQCRRGLEEPELRFHMTECAWTRKRHLSFVPKVDRLVHSALATPFSNRARILCTL